jgi:hypothetical protein
MTRREPPASDGQDTRDDRIRAQRSSRCGEDVLEDDLSYRSSAPMIGIDTPKPGILDHTPSPLTERLWG